ncbi:hypothetical protein C9I49_27430 [Pseudomonas prosekii]|uniref:Uncharacterized protein n=2 Tax=Pseudomonas TaxID=286 RepID=A0A2U2D091_9PSED|nr:hypothetical protein C9I49_27430 [Pseudomonas prosekii]
MKYEIWFVIIDTTVNAESLNDRQNLGVLQMETVNTSDNPLYKHCRNIRELEVAFERYRNFPTSDDVVQSPHAKFKVLRIDPVPVYS